VPAAHGPSYPKPVAAARISRGSIVERRIVTMPARDWEAFEAWANRPAEEIAGLKDLARMAPTWQK